MVITRWNNQNDNIAKHENASVIKRNILVCNIVIICKIRLPEASRVDFGASSWSCADGPRLFDGCLWVLFEGRKSFSAFWPNRVIDYRTNEACVILVGAQRKLVGGKMWWVNTDTRRDVRPIRFWWLRLTHLMCLSIKRHYVGLQRLGLTITSCINQNVLPSCLYRVIYKYGGLPRFCLLKCGSLWGLSPLVRMVDRREKI